MYVLAGAPLEAPARGVVRLNLNLKDLGFVKIGQLTEGEKRKHTHTHTHTHTHKQIAQSPGHRAEKGLQVYQGSPVMVSSIHSPQQ